MRRLVAVALLAALVAPATVSRADPVPQDDAGSGRDAPDTAAPDVRIRPGAAYSGTLDGVADDGDWYAFDAPAGAGIAVRLGTAVTCTDVVSGTGTVLASRCTGGYAETGRLDTVAPVTGEYYVHVYYFVPQRYWFSLGVGAAAAPHPGPADAGVFAGGGAIPRVARAREADKHVVVAVVDTGVNLYHQFFRAPALTSHPSDWLPGFPASATPVRLTLDAPDWASANAADAGTFAGLRRSTLTDEHLYTFPGTRVVAGISFGEYEDTGFPVADPRPIRDDHGHGTHSAGLVAGANLPAADGNVVLVAVEVGKGTFDMGIRWAARQPWIDAVSISLGNVANVPTTGPEAATREAAASGKPVFVGAGNGFSNTGLAPDHCSTYTSPYTGPVWVTRVGAARSGDGSPTWWHCLPVETIARTDVLSPAFDQLAGAGVATGTSASTPNVAGHYARLLLAARRRRAKATRTEVLAYLLHAAQPPATDPGAHDPSAYPLSLADQGYGLVDAAAVDAALARIRARSGPLPRPETETWFETDSALRVRIWGSSPP